MQKAINIENTDNGIARVLSIADISAAATSPNGLTYIGIENYTEPLLLGNPLDINYPMYNKASGEFYWVTVEYQNTATANLIEVENLKQLVAVLQAEKDSLQEVVDALLLESLGGM